MIIAIDGNEANIEKRVGVNRFAFEVIWHIYKYKLKTQNAKRKTTTKSSKLRSLEFLVFLTEKPMVDLPPETEWWKYEVFGPKKFWTWTGLVKRLFLGKPKPDILFSPSHYGPFVSPIPFVISIMDLGFLRFRKQFTRRDFIQLKYWTKWSIRRAKKVIAISEFTKRDIVETYRVDPRKIVVAYPGYKKMKSEKLKIKSYRQELRTIREKYGIEGEYILFLGTLKPSKNVEGLIDAFLILTTKYGFKELQLVIIGKKGWLYNSIFEKVKNLGLEKNITFTDFISDEEGELLMANANVFVTPSFWEGFGIPAVEAMSLGVPVVASDRGSLPEVIGGAGIIVNPENPDEIALGIKKALSQKTRGGMIEKGKRRVKMFSWERCSKIILETLIEISPSPDKSGSGRN